jgi:dynein heavy chain 2
LKQNVNLSHLFNPDTFLNALRQKSARTSRVAIDDMKLVSSFENGKIESETVVKLEGLWLQGSDFDGQRVSDIRDIGGNSQELLQLPSCNIAWISQQLPDPYPEMQTVDTPVYHSIDREKLLCTLKVSNNGEEWKRVISGVALFLNGSEV